LLFVNGVKRATDTSGIAFPSNTLNKWVNIAGTLSLGATTSTIKGYVNGISVGSTTIAKNPYNGDGQIIVGSNAGTYNVGQVLVSNNVTDIDDNVIYQNYYATKQYFGY